SSHFIAFMHLAAALALARDARGAAKARADLLRLKPGFNAGYVRKVWPFSRTADWAKIVQARSQAGRSARGPPKPRRALRECGRWWRMGAADQRIKSVRVHPK